LAKRYLFIETDGKVYLEERDGRLDLPTQESKLPFPVKVRTGFKALGADVAYAKPTLDRHPEEWTDKDLIPSLDEATPVARAAVLATMHRLVVNAVVLEEGRVLMVKANRGISRGWWNLPGGFVEWDEAPEDCVHREVAEELGAKVLSSELITVLSRRFEPGPYYMVAFMFKCTLDRKEVSLDRTELDEAAWFPLDRASRETRNPFAKEVFQRLRTAPPTRAV
jgi:ADP-ribose pyrophosphatase YjhB (NUDIX family)